MNFSMLLNAQRIEIIAQTLVLGLEKKQDAHLNQLIYGMNIRYFLLKHQLMVKILRGYHSIHLVLHQIEMRFLMKMIMMLKALAKLQAFGLILKMTKAMLMLRYLATIQVR